MKKILSLLAVVLFAGSMMAQAACLYSFDSSEDHSGSNNAYANNCDITIDGITWNLTGNSQMNPWRVGGKSLSATDRELYSKTAFASALDSIVLNLGLSTLTSVNGIKLIYSTNADFSEAETIIATVPASFPAAIHFAPADGFAANMYYKFVFTCTNTSSKDNKYLQVLGVEFWGEAAPAGLPEGPAISVDATAGTFSIVPANDEDIYMFLLLTEEVEGGISFETATAMAEQQVSWIDADFTLEDFMDMGSAYQGALEDIPFEMLFDSAIPEGDYAMAAFTLVENDPVAHTAEITSQITYIEFTISAATALENMENGKAVKVLNNGQVIIIREGVRYNVAGQIVK